MTVDARDFRNALGTFATGVTIVTTMSKDGTPVGLTANSFTSVSLDPPLVLFCLDRRSYSYGHFEKASHFAVNVLAAEQQAVSNHFARPSEDKWTAGRCSWASRRRRWRRTRGSRRPPSRRPPGCLRTRRSTRAATR
jgi:flavin reductase (DIM6/NTAB) family NADH-FMN oxidoreductase RutF